MFFYETHFGGPNNRCLVFFRKTRRQFDPDVNLINHASGRVGMETENQA